MVLWLASISLMKPAMLVVVAAAGMGAVAVVVRVAVVVVAAAVLVALVRLFLQMFTMAVVAPCLQSTQAFASAAINTA